MVISDCQLKQIYVFDDYFSIPTKKKDETKERNNNKIHTLLAAFSLNSHSGG